MSNTLYRKYRPQKFEEVIGQDHIKITLQNEIENGNISHAYLFFGPRGIGKTTLARVLAKSINCKDKTNSEPCNKCEMCESINSGNFLDLIEIDAASNRGINEIRELREMAKYSPSRGQYKVFIIDEAHMLTIEAFNALLKTLEEPPKHAIFILATTEFHKLPSTIISRCQKFEFKVVDLDKLKVHLQNVCDKEGVKVESGVLELLTKHSGGYVRDALSMLGQVLALSENNSVDLATASLIFPKSNIESVIELVDNILFQKFDFAIKGLSKVVSSGIDLEYFTEELINYLRKAVLIKLSGASQDYLWDVEKDIEQKLIEQSEKLDLNIWQGILEEFYNAFEHLKNERFKQLPLEIAIISIKNKFFTEKKEDSNIFKGGGNIFSNKSKDDPKKEEKIEETKSSSSIKSSIEDIVKIWPQLLINLKDYNHSLSAFVKVGHPLKISKDRIMLGFQYKFHLDRILDDKNKKTIEELISGIINEKITISAEIDDNYEENHQKMIIIDKREELDGGAIEDLIQNFGGEVVG